MPTILRYDSFYYLAADTAMILSCFILHTCSSQSPRSLRCHRRRLVLARNKIPRRCFCLCCHRPCKRQPDRIPQHAQQSHQSSGDSSLGNASPAPIGFPEDFRNCSPLSFLPPLEVVLYLSRSVLDLTQQFFYGDVVVVLRLIHVACSSQFSFHVLDLHVPDWRIH